MDFFLWGTVLFGAGILAGWRLKMQLHNTEKRKLVDSLDLLQQKNEDLEIELGVLEGTEVEEVLL